MRRAYARTFRSNDMMIPYSGKKDLKHIPRRDAMRNP
jgi:hypothetical protein